MYTSRASSQSQRDCPQFDCGPVYYNFYMKNKYTYPFR